MSDKLDEIESTLQRSTKIIRRLARKMATDKYIWVFSLLVLGAIIALIVVKEVNKNGGVANTIAAASCQFGETTGSHVGGTCAPTATAAPSSNEFKLMSSRLQRLKHMLAG